MKRGTARINLRLVLIAVWFAAGSALLDACNSSGNGPIATPAPTATATPPATPTPAPPATPTPTPTATPTPAPPATPRPAPTATATPGPPATTGSSALTVDPATQLAFVPLLTSPDPATGNSRIAVINTAVDPDVTNAIVGTIVLTHPDIITSVALDTTDHWLIVTSGGVGNGGLVDLTNESTDQPIIGSPFKMPPGVDVEQLATGVGFGQAVFDPLRKVAVISTVDDLVQNNCPGAGDCTGFITFNLSTFKFTSVTQTIASYSFAFNPQTDVAIPASLETGSEVGVAVDVKNSISCKLNDQNLAASPIGVSFDPLTNLALMGNDDGTATALNLVGSSFVFENSPPCFLIEGGTIPNSIQVTGLPAASSAVAVNPITHQAFLLEEDILPTDFNDGISLLNLPSIPVPQISSNHVSMAATSDLPFDPFGFFWQTQSAPFQVALDSVHNRAYAVTLFGYFMAQIDLAAFAKNPAGISVPPPFSTSCFDLPISFGCNNQNGLIFYPLPPAFGQ